jgi:hypothetical protein
LGLSDLSERAAVLQAMAEYDQLGRDAFLARYGYGPARSYFVLHDGKQYDSKALAGVAIGKQFPASGALAASDFSGGEATVKAKLEELGFEVTGPLSSDSATITSGDVQLLRESRSKARYADITPEEREAYKRIDAALRGLSRIAIETFGNSSSYLVQFTSGFHLVSGVRGALPKDLWFGIYRRENIDAFVGHPQLFMIVSGRETYSGIEYGFAATTHPADFSNQQIKDRLREAAPKIYSQLPSPQSDAARSLAGALGNGWCYQRKQRLEPDQTNFPSLDAWLEYLRSPAGVSAAGGSVSKFVPAKQLDNVKLDDVVREMAGVFRP